MTLDGRSSVDMLNGMAIIKASFAGQCKACGGSFPAGAQISWTRGVGSKHAKCHDAPAVVEKAPITVTLDCRHLGKPGVDSEVGRTFRVTDRGEHAGKVVTVLTQRSRYQSAEDNEDMGDCMGGGWWLTLGCRPATPEETAKLEAEEGAERTTEAARRQKIADEKAAKDAEIATAKAKLAELTAGLVVTESFDAGVLVPEQAPVTVVKWSDGPRHYVDVVERKAVTGETVYIAYSHDFDDDRSTLYAPRPVVEASWAKVTERYRETPEKAREWLAKYSSNCVGADWRRWLVEQTDAN